MRLSVEALGFSYNGTPVLEDVAFELDRGEILSVVGPNGSGKTTLLKCIDRILIPQRGSVMIDGEDIRHLGRWETAKKMGYVPQHTGRDLPMTVFDAVLMGRKPYIRWAPSERDLDLVSNIIEILGLGKLAMRDINELSGGERQKVMVGRALAQEPNVLILDEPTASLDLKHQLEVLKLVKEQTRGGISAVIAIHDLNLALRFSDKVVMLDRGRVFAKGGLEVLDSRNIESVYDVKVRVINDGNCVYVVPKIPVGDGNGRAGSDRNCQE